MMMEMIRTHLGASPLNVGDSVEPSDIGQLV
jgi:hypothetical protein